MENLEKAGHFVSIISMTTCVIQVVSFFYKILDRHADRAVLSRRCFHNSMTALFDIWAPVKFDIYRICAKPPIKTHPDVRSEFWFEPSSTSIQVYESS